MHGAAQQPGGVLRRCPDEIWQWDWSANKVPQAR